MENIDIFEPILFEIGELGFGIDKESDENPRRSYVQQLIQQIQAVTH